MRYDYAHCEDAPILNDCGENELMRDNTMQRRITVILGFGLAFAMGASLILPLLSTNLNNPAQTILPTATAAPTLPAPIANLGDIQFDETFLHESGLFEAAVPTGWRVINQATTTNEAQATLQNAEQLSVVEMRVIQPVEAISNNEALSDIFDNQWLGASWREYTSWTEDTRDVEENRVTMNFTLRRGQQEFIARQIATTDGEWVYVTRVVTPPNASEMLQYVLTETSETITPNKQFNNAPFAWVSYFDESDGHFIRFPQIWQVVDAAPGAPATIEGDLSTLRVESDAVQLNTADEALGWIEGWRSGVTAIASEAVEQFGYEGFRVSYSLETLDGVAESGVAILLNDGEGTLHIANLRVPASGLDLLNAEEAGEFAESLAVLDTFTINPRTNNES
jgi:hypothetical protein